MSHAELYLEKPEGYFDSAQSWVADLIPSTGVRVLDVGCGEGTTGALLKSRGIAREVHGIELVEAAAARAAGRLDSVTVGNIEQMDIPFEPGSFDVIVITEVLEHLVDPWQAVRRLQTYLRDGGCIIASMPNVRNFHVLWPLLFAGKWEYQDSGILDRTHLRFFTKSSMIELFTQAGLCIDVIEPILYRAKYINRLLFNMPEEFLARRYMCRVRK